MPKQIVKAYWDAMATNDFAHAGQWLSDDFQYYMPLSKEYLQGRDAFVELNTTYPTDGVWRFHLRTLVAEGDTVVSDVAVSDGTIHARAITFHTVRDGKICQQIEYWPDDYPAPEWRSHLVTRRETCPFS